MQSQQIKELKAQVAKLEKLILALCSNVTSISSGCDEDGYTQYPRVMAAPSKKILKMIERLTNE